MLMSSMYYCKSGMLSYSRFIRCLNILIFFVYVLIAVSLVNFVSSQQQLIDTASLTVGEKVNIIK